MKSNCNSIQDRLATDGPQALRDDANARSHVAECTDCFRVLEALNEIDSGLEALSRFDASDAVVERLLQATELDPIGEPTLRTGGWRRLATAADDLFRPRRLIWSSVAAGLLLVVVAVVTRNESSLQPLDATLVAERNVVAPPLEEQLSAAPTDSVRAPMPPPPKPARRPAAGKKDQDEQSRLESATERRNERVKVTAQRRVIDLDKSESSTKFNDDFITDLPVASRQYQSVLTLAPGTYDAEGDAEPTVHGSRSRDVGSSVSGVEHTDPLTGQFITRENSNPNSIEEMELVVPRSGVDFKQIESTPVLIAASRVTPAWPEAAAGLRINTRVVVQVTVRTDGTVDEPTVLACTNPDYGFEESAIVAVVQWRFDPARRGTHPVEARWTLTIDFDPATYATGGDSSSLRPDHDLRIARTFLESRNTINGVVFAPATGYWRSTYVPGDPTLRVLQARLADQDLTSLNAYVNSAPRLHTAARQTGQPFDTPDSSALAVYLHADRRGLSEPGRMLVQVGLEGSPRHGGRRPAMNLALVLDLRDEIATDVALGIRALLAAFNRVREPDDSFSVFVAGRSGGRVVAADDFRHGYLKVTLDRLIDGPAIRGTGLVDAVSAAITSIAAADDGETPLGSSAVVLISGRGFGDATRALGDVAHQGAVAGVPLSVIGIGADVDLSDIDHVTLAGQGTRRLLDDPAGATELVERELASASRAVARAVRLRIRLAPGVKLVDVIGSERLDATRAQAVREAERSIDLRLSRSLGIDADRGEDEEGIQIVIPAFYSGDSHAILLDVVAPGPGAIADVTLRYKDLVHLRNGVSRASLRLARDGGPDGPLERNVLKNLLARRLSRTLETAGQALASGDADRAQRVLGEFAALLAGLRHELSGLDNDPDLLRDAAMLDEYSSLLAVGAALRPDHRAFIADSLRYAARLKVLPRPLETRS